MDCARRQNQQMGSAEQDQMKVRRRRISIIVQLSLLAALLGTRVAFLSLNVDWNLLLAGILFGFIFAAEYMAFPLKGGGRVSGSIIVLVVSAVLLDSLPAMGLGIAATLVSWLKWREAPRHFWVNLINCAIYPLAAGMFFHYTVRLAGVDQHQLAYYLLVFATYAVALLINFMLLAADRAYVEEESFTAIVMNALVPLLPSQFLGALMVMGIVYVYFKVGVVGLAFLGIVILSMQYLIGALLTSQRRAGDLQERTFQLEDKTKQLASFQVGLLGALVRALDLRDQMTARHSAAVARYSRLIAIELGLSQEQADLAHAAGLLHDIGKFVLPDRILKADERLSEKDWELIKSHPQQGANVISTVDGYGPVSEIVLSHHERVDGSGYPRGLSGDEIPLLARVISVADTYDVLVSRDTYQTPLSHDKAVQELRAVAGVQLDPEVVDAFIRLLDKNKINFEHSLSSDFDKELNLEKRIAGLSATDEDMLSS